jgi:hypothetical protein
LIETRQTISSPGGQAGQDAGDAIVSDLFTSIRDQTKNLPVKAAHIEPTKINGEIYD